MTLGQELREVMSGRHPDIVCLGGVCYLRLDGGNLAKAEFTSSGGNYNGLRLTVLNCRTGPVDSVTLHFWELSRSPTKTPSGCGEAAAWDVYRPSPDISALAEMAEEYLSLFRGPDPEQQSIYPSRETSTV